MRTFPSNKYYDSSSMVVRGWPEQEKISFVSAERIVGIAVRANSPARTATSSPCHDGRQKLANQPKRRSVIFFWNAALIGAVSAGQAGKTVEPSSQPERRKTMVNSLISRPTMFANTSR